MGGSIFNPINDIKNIVEGTKNLIVNPAKQFDKYILPAAKSALPVAAVAATSLIPGAQALLPEAIAGAVGTYGTQIATKGLGNLTSGGTPSIGDFAAGLAAAGAVGAISALGAPATGLTTSVNGVGTVQTGTSAFMSGISQVGSDIEGGISSIGSALGIGGGSTMGASSALAASLGTAAGGSTLLGTVGGALWSAAPYLALGGLSLYENSKQAASEKAAMQQMQNEINQQQLGQACSTVLNLSDNDLMFTQWSQLLPQLSPSCRSQISSQIPNKLTDADLSEMMYYAAIGQIQTADMNALFAILPSSLVSQAKSLYNSCLGSQTASQIASSQTAMQDFVNCLYKNSMSPTGSGVSPSMMTGYPQIGSTTATTTTSGSIGLSPLGSSTTMTSGNIGLSPLGSSVTTHASPAYTPTLTSATVSPNYNQTGPLGYLGSPGYSYSGEYQGTNTSQFYNSPQVVLSPNSAYYSGTNVAQFTNTPVSAPHTTYESGTNVKNSTISPQKYTGAQWLVYETEKGFNGILDSLKVI